MTPINLGLVNISCDNADAIEMSTEPKKFQILILPIFLFFLSSCASNPPAGKPSKAAQSSEADVDAALGVLSEPGKTETEKQAEALRDEKNLTDAELAQYRREREEEQRRIQRNITEDLNREQH